MNSIFKRIAAVAAAAAMTVGLAGCGNNGGSSAGGSTSTDAAAAGGEGGTLVIGGIGPITGPAAQYGVAVKNGAQLAVDEINEAGGVNGMKLELNYQDDEHDPEKSVNAYNALKDKGMKLLVGTVTSGPCEAVSKEAAKDNMFLITPSGSSVDCITAGDNCFRMCFTDPKQGAIAADYISDTMGKKKVAVIYDSSDSYSSGIVEGFEKEAGVKGIDVVAKEAFTADSNTDFSVQIQKVQESGAELLFLPFYYTEAALVIQQAQGKIDIPIFGGDGLDGLIGYLEDKVDVADGVYVMSPYAASSPDPKSKAFTDAYNAKFPNDEVNQFAADAYDCVYAVKQALEKADVKDASISASDLCDKLKAAMLEIELEGVTGNTKWTSDGESEKAPKVMKIKAADGVGTYEML